MNTFGSTDWAKRNGGVLSTGEKLGELLRAMRSQLQVSVSRRLGLRPRQTFSLMADLEMPKSALCAAVAPHFATMPPWLVAHSMRSWFYGTALARLDGVAYDPELAFVACALHDVALGVPGEEACFAHRGGEIARTTCLQAGASESRAAIVAEAICRHLGVDVPKEAEAFVVRSGSGCDVIGQRAEAIAAPLRHDVLNRYPRGDFAREVMVPLEAEAKAHPGTRVALLCGPMHFARLTRKADRFSAS